MALESEQGPTSPEFNRVSQLLTSRGQIKGETKPNFQQIIGKQTKLGRVDVQPIGIDCVEIQIFSPDHVYTKFNIFDDHVEAYAEKGPGLQGDRLPELPFTLEEVLAELER